MTDLFELGQKYFKDFLQEFAGYGIHADPGLELRKGTGMLCYYNLKDRHIYLSVPDPQSPVGRLQLLFLRSLLRCDNNEELLRFFGLFIPHVIAHELAHHFRHRYGLFSDNMWQEEQVANKLSASVIKHRLSPEEKEEARRFLRRAIEGLSEKIEAKNIAVDSYYSVLHALNVSGQIGVADFENIELIQTLFDVEPEEMLKGSGQLSEELLERLEQRDDIIDDINEQYASDQIKYIYYHVGWLYLDLTSRETEYVEEFARTYLGLQVDLLPAVEVPPQPSDQAVQACFRAYQDTLPYSKIGSRYFYKRYRSLLLARLQEVELLAPAQTERLKKEARLILESWSEQKSDTLNYLAQLAPLSIRKLFPHLITDHLEPQLAVRKYLPSETDQRLWQHIVLQTEDEGAASTLYRLGFLDQTDVYRSLPAEVGLELVHQFCQVRFALGETVIWEGDRNDDVYILLSGKLEVFVTRDGAVNVIGAINPGEMFGEIAFFTEDPRYATVRAVEPAECFVLKDSDLQLFAFKHPSILMQMAGVIAKRLTDAFKLNSNAMV